MQIKRLCKQCGKSKHMIREIDRKYKIFDQRYRVCFECQPILTNDTGDLTYFQDADDQEVEQSQ